ARLDSLPDRPAGKPAWAQDEALLGQPHVLRGRAHDPPNEEVEQHEERNLECQQHALVRRTGNHSRSVLKVTSVEPTVKMSPDSSFDRFTRRPFTSIPFVESRSTIQYVEPSCRSSAWRRETFGSSTWMSHSRERPRRMLRLSTRRV